MKVLYVASEAVPFVKTGGLADVAGSLPKSLKEAGIDVRVILPKFSQIFRVELVDVPFERTAKGSIKRHLYQ